MQTACTPQQRGVSIVGLTDDTRLSILRVDELTDDAVRCLIGTVPSRIVGRVHALHGVGVGVIHTIVRCPAELFNGLSVDSLPGERCAANEEDIVLGSIYRVFTEDLIVRLDVDDHNIALRTVDQTGVAVEIMVPVELLQDVQHLTYLCVVASQLGTNETGIEEVEHRLTAEATLLVVLVGTIVQGWVARTSHTDITLGDGLQVGHNVLQVCNVNRVRSHLCADGLTVRQLLNGYLQVRQPLCGCFC